MRELVILALLINTKIFMKAKFYHFILVFVLMLGSIGLTAQRKTTKNTGQSQVIPSELLNNIQFRNIGPSLMSGRIADIAIHPENHHVWYVAVGSGGIWKTENSGTTWTPVFDQYGAYSIGCITIDPHNFDRIWAGTGENVGGRHVGYGDGLYRSEDGGKSWMNVGLKNSEHISKIIIHPNDPQTIWVAAQGPLWSKGGERGVFKSTDGGKSWSRTLGDDQWTGATDLLIDPRNQNRLYAATWQRHRSVAAYMGGGPGTGIYRSEDGGKNWEKLTKGLPAEDMGKIGLAISPQQPDVVYAAIELKRRTGGVFKSTDRGASWTKQSDAVAGGTGPHYYQELYACPHQFDKLYLVDVFMQISEDGGKNFQRMNTRNIHVDNHAIAFRSSDPNYVLVGNDGGLYETFDKTKSWKFVANLPVTQFYKVAVDDDYPFYNVYGGTQDNNTQGGPSRTDNVHGIRNADWFVTLFGDGHQPATEPGNPDIVYSQWQQGNLTRFDRRSGEMMYIKPQPSPGEPIERFNWDAPILVSPHNPKRLYFASQRVWRSDDRGDSWTPISADLTHNRERINERLMGRLWSWDAPWDLLAMSDYSTITSLSESPVKEGLIWTGSDDGLIYLTENGGENWTRIPITNLPGVPATAFINDIKADLYDPSTVFVVLDNHKFGDLEPYLFKSNDMGKTWKSLRSNLPARNLLWRIVQDHLKPELMFLATEFGIWFTHNGGDDWTQLKGGLPVISFRDLAIQKRENDLVAASFGRGFFILDDYSPLREINNATLEKDAVLFSLRPALWYIQRETLGNDQKATQGDAYYVADNPPFGAVFTYYIKNDYLSLTRLRQQSEKDARAQLKDIPFPGWDAVEKERRTPEPSVVLVIRDADNQFITSINAANSKGFHRLAWDLRKPSSMAMRAGRNWSPGGPMVAPGNYSATLYLIQDGKYEKLSDSQNFEVKALQRSSLKGSSPAETAAFWGEIEEVIRMVSAAAALHESLVNKVNLLEQALSRTPVEPEGIINRIHQLKAELHRLDETINGNASKRSIGEDSYPTMNSRLFAAVYGTYKSTYGPTPNHRQQLAYAREEFQTLRSRLEQIRSSEIPALEKTLFEAGAPWIDGMSLPE